MRRFGQVEFDPAARKLAVSGRPVEIDRRCIAVLALLFDEAGKDVDKDRLLAAGWPGQIVHENSLAKAIGRLRQALGEDGHLIETAHGHGYRLALAAAGAPDEVDAARPPRRTGRWLLAALVATLSVLGLAQWLGLNPAGEQRLIRGEPADIVGRVLWVDDHPANNAKEKLYLEQHKVAVYQVKTTEEALNLLSMYSYRAVISDMNRNGKLLDGFTLVREMRKRKDATPFFLYTFVASPAQNGLLAEAGGQGAATSPDELYAALLPLMGKPAPAR